MSQSKGAQVFAFCLKLWLHWFELSPIFSGNVGDPAQSNGRDWNVFAHAATSAGRRHQSIFLLCFPTIYSWSWFMDIYFDNRCILNKQT